MILTNMADIVKGFSNIFQGKFKIFLSQKENKHAEALSVPNKIIKKAFLLNIDLYFNTYIYI